MVAAAKSRVVSKLSRVPLHPAASVRISATSRRRQGQLHAVQGPMARLARMGDPLLVSRVVVGVRVILDSTVPTANPKLHVKLLQMVRRV